MIRLLIVDDEEIIADSIYNFFLKQHELNADVFKAYDVDLAVGLLEKYKIDVIVSDINMPGKSGIEFMKIVKEKWPLCRFIFLTGYDYFEYAYEALKAGGVRYILKTEGYEKLLVTVKEEIDQYEKSIEKENLLAGLDDFILKHKDLICRDHVFDILDNKIKLEDVINDEKIGRFFPLDLSRKVLPAAIKYGVSINEKEYGDKMRTIGLSRMTAEKWISLRKCEVVTFVRNDEMVILAQPEPDEDESRFRSFVYQVAESIQDEISKSTGDDITIVVPNGLVPWNELHNIYKSMCSVVAKSYDPSGGLILTCDLKSERIEADVMDEYEWFVRETDKLETMMCNCEKENAVDLVNRILNRFYAVPEKEIKFQILSKIANTIITYAYRCNLHHELFERFDMDSLINAAIISNIEKYTENLIGSMNRFFELLKDKRENHRTRNMEAIEKYIDDNISRNITLSELAEISHYNASYLSKIFKEITGRSITDHIQEKKIEHAKELLETGDLRVSEISERLSFGSARYFTEVFRKMTGMSPSAWKESFGTEPKNNIP